MDMVIWMVISLLHSLIAFFRHLRYATDPVWFWVSWEIVQAAGHYAAYMMLLGLIGLLVRRIFVDRVRHISAPSDYLMLILIIGIALSGLMMKWYPTDIFAFKQFLLGLIYFSWSEFPSDFCFLVHLGLVISSNDNFPLQ